MEKIKDRLLKFFHLDSIMANLSGYVEAKVALVKIEIREEVAGILTKGLMMMLIFMVGFLFLLFATLGLAQYLNTVTESEFWGYMIVAGFFGILLALLVLLRKSFFKLFGKQFMEMIKQRES